MGNDLNWDSMSEAQREIKLWADQKFGPERTWKLALDKLTYHEIPELFQHLMQKGFIGVGSELADCFILLLDLAELWGVDLSAEIRAKMQINHARKWRVDPVTGLSQHVEEVTGDGQPAEPIKQPANPAWWCCEQGLALGVKICPTCAEISRGYQAAMGPGPPDRYAELSARYAAALGASAQQWRNEFEQRVAALMQAAIYERDSSHERVSLNRDGIGVSPIEDALVRGEPLGSGGDDSTPVGGGTLISGGHSGEADLSAPDGNDFPQLFR